jgi:putative endonuclease
VTRQSRDYYVYIMSNAWHTIYTGVTSNLSLRVWQHKNKVEPGFSSKYNCTLLVYYETTDDVWAAIEREKQIKGWLRSKKTALIRSFNPEWRDLSVDWMPPEFDGQVPDPSLRSGRQASS